MKYMSTKFNFNPLNFETLASFSWECLQIKIELELLIDVDMILDYESAVWGGKTAIWYYGEPNCKPHTFSILI